MAQAIKSFEFRQGGHFGSRYDKYLDGQIWKLALGVDCPKTLIYVRSQLYARARLAGGKIRIAADGDKHIVVQFYKNGIAKAAQP